MPITNPDVSNHVPHHEIRASSFGVPRVEDLREIAQLKADAVACYQPVNAQELFAIERIALAQQMILKRTGGHSGRRCAR